MRKTTESKKRKMNRKRNLITAAALIIGAVTTAALLGAATPETTQTEEETYKPEPIPYWMTEEYQEEKRQEQEEAEREGAQLRAMIEKCREEEQLEAERQYAELQATYKDRYKEPEIPEEYLDGFSFYQIPEDYEREGGYFPERVQKYAYALCRKEGVDFATIIAMAETETGYQSDKVGEAGDSGYLQVVPEWHEETMEEKGLTDPTDPYQGMELGIIYMSELLEQYDGNYAKALTAYNAGPLGAYKYWFSAGVEASPYAKGVMKKAERIRKELGAE